MRTVAWFLAGRSRSPRGRAGASPRPASSPGSASRRRPGPSWTAAVGMEREALRRIALEAFARTPGFEVPTGEPAKGAPRCRGRHRARGGAAHPCAGRARRPRCSSGWTVDPGRRRRPGRRDRPRRGAGRRRGSRRQRLPARHPVERDAGGPRAGPGARGGPQAGRGGPARPRLGGPQACANSRWGCWPTGRTRPPCPGSSPASGTPTRRWPTARWARWRRSATRAAWGRSSSSRGAGRGPSSRRWSGRWGTSAAARPRPTSRRMAERPSRSAGARGGEGGAAGREAAPGAAGKAGSRGEVRRASRPRFEGKMRAVIRGPALLLCAALAGCAHAVAPRPAARPARGPPDPDQPTSRSRWGTSGPGSTCLAAGGRGAAEAAHGPHRLPGRRGLLRRRLPGRAQVRPRLHPGPGPPDPLRALRGRSLLDRPS